MLKMMALAGAFFIGLTGSANAWEAGSRIAAATICWERTDAHHLASMHESKGHEAAADVFFEYVMSGKCEYHKSLFTVYLVKRLESYVIDGVHHSLWSVNDKNLFGYIILPAETRQS